MKLSSGRAKSIVALKFVMSPKRMLDAFQSFPRENINFWSSNLKIENIFYTRLLEVHPGPELSVP